MIFLHTSSRVYFHACLGVSSSVPAIARIILTFARDKELVMKIKTYV